MASFLGPALRALATGRGAHLQGKDVAAQRAEQQRKVEEARQVRMIEMALEDVARREKATRDQENSDRDYGLKAMAAMNPAEKAAPRDFVKEHEANRLFDIKNPLPSRARLGGSRSSGGTGPEGPSASDARLPGMADKFVNMYLDAYGGDVKRALTAVNGTPAESAKAKSLGLTFAHWQAAVARRRAKAAQDAGKIEY